jgi:hypothetical protein
MRQVVGSSAPLLHTTNVVSPDVDCSLEQKIASVYWHNSYY